MTRHLSDKLVFYGSTIFPIFLSLCLDMYFLPYILDYLRGNASQSGLLAFYAIWGFSWVSALISLFAILVYRSPLSKDEDNIRNLQLRGHPSSTLILAYVTYGKNRTTLKDSLAHSTAILKKFGVPFAIEIVTEIPVDDLIPASPSLHIYEVPNDYQSANRSLFKARALHYLKEQRRNRLKNLENIWILHMDEESRLTEEALAGIQKFIRDPDNANSVGQGEIHYSAYPFPRNPILSALESKRTGDDLIRFRLQYKMFSLALFGMHGSFILTPAELEDQVGFDVGPQGSLTEDIYFASKARNLGCRFRWVEGFIQEQPPLTIPGMLRQRRRWFCGLRNLVFDPGVPVSHKVFIAYSLFFWIFMALLIFGTLLQILLLLAYGSATIFLLHAVARLFSLRILAPQYLVGAYRNLQDLPISLAQKLLFYCCSLLLIPLCSMLESLAVVYAIFRPVNSFDIIKKA